MADNATPRPWTLKPYGEVVQEDEFGANIVAACGRKIRRTRTVTTEQEANARLIVKAVNERQELLDALKLCYDVIDEVTAEGLAEYIGVDRVTDAYQAARRALAKAKKS